MGDAPSFPHTRPQGSHRWEAPAIGGLSGPCDAGLLLRHQCGATRLASSRIPLMLFGTRGYVDPPNHLPRNQIHVHTIPKTPHRIARVPAPKGRPQIVPVGVTPGNASPSIRMAPPTTHSL